MPAPPPFPARFEASGTGPPPPSPRARLAGRLRRRRLAAGLSTTRLAVQLGISQSKASKLELGQVPAKPDDVRAWAQMTGADAEETTALVEEAEAALLSARGWGLQGPGWLGGQQREVGALEAAAGRVRTFNPTAVPGLLQTAEYARRVVLLLDQDPEGVPAAVAARQARQAVLYDERRSFEFLLGEAALRWCPGPSALMVAQIRHLESAMTLANVRLGVLPFGEVPDTVMGEFVLYDQGGDDPLVTSELWGGTVESNRPDQFAEYEAVLRRLGAVSLWGDDALGFLHRLAAGLRARPDNPDGGGAG